MQNFNCLDFFLIKKEEKTHGKKEERSCFHLVKRHGRHLYEASCYSSVLGGEKEQHKTKDWTGGTWLRFHKALVLIRMFTELKVY